MSAFLAYLARRKYDLQQMVQNEQPDSPFLQTFQGALEELIAIIKNLPEQEREMVDNLFNALAVVLEQQAENEPKIPSPEC